MQPDAQRGERRLQARPGHVDAQLTAALTSITDSLKGQQNQTSGSSNSLSQLLPFMTLAKGKAGGCPGGNCGR